VFLGESLGVRGLYFYRVEKCERGDWVMERREGLEAAAMKPRKVGGWLGGGCRIKGGLANKRSESIH